MIANVYIDGFNLYYGCLRGTSFKWLDPDALCRRLLPNDQIRRIRYFTAKVNSRVDDPGAPQRQDTYLRALATIPNLTVHLGHFLTSTTRMPLAKVGRGRTRTLGIAVGVPNPHPARKRSSALDPTFFKQIRGSVLAQCQFPETMKDAVGSFGRPTTW